MTGVTNTFPPGHTCVNCTSVDSDHATQVRHNKGHSEHEGNNVADDRATWAQNGGSKNESDINSVMAYLRQQGREVAVGGVDRGVAKVCHRSARNETPGSVIGMELHDSVSLMFSLRSHISIADSGDSFRANDGGTMDEWRGRPSTQSVVK